MKLNPAIYEHPDKIYLVSYWTGTKDEIELVDEVFKSKEEAKL